MTHVAFLAIWERMTLSDRERFSEALNGLVAAVKKVDAALTRAGEALADEAEVYANGGPHDTRALGDGGD